MRELDASSGQRFFFLGLRAPRRPRRTSRCARVDRLDRDPPRRFPPIRRGAGGLGQSHQPPNCGRGALSWLNARRSGVARISGTRRARGDVDLGRDDLCSQPRHPGRRRPKRRTTIAPRGLAAAPMTLAIPGPSPRRFQPTAELRRLDASSGQRFLFLGLRAPRRPRRTSRSARADRVDPDRAEPLPSDQGRRGQQRADHTSRRIAAEELCPGSTGGDPEWPEFPEPTERAAMLISAEIISAPSRTTPVEGGPRRGTTTALRGVGRGPDDAGDPRALAAAPMTPRDPRALAPAARTLATRGPAPRR